MLSWIAGIGGFVYIVLAQKNGQQADPPPAATDDMTATETRTSHRPNAASIEPVLSSPQSPPVQTEAAPEDTAEADRRSNRLVAVVWFGSLLVLIVVSRLLAGDATGEGTCWGGFCT